MILVIPEHHLAGCCYCRTGVDYQEIPYESITTIGVDNRGTVSYLY